MPSMRRTISALGWASVAGWSCFLVLDVVESSFSP